MAGYLVLLHLSLALAGCRGAGLFRTGSAAPLDSRSHRAVVAARTFILPVDRSSITARSVAPSRGPGDNRADIAGASSCRAGAAGPPPWLTGPAARRSSPG